MTTKKKGAAAAKRAPASVKGGPASKKSPVSRRVRKSADDITAESAPVSVQLGPTSVRLKGAFDLAHLKERLRELDIRPRGDEKKFLNAVNSIKPDAAVPLGKLPTEVRESIAVLRPKVRSFHGTKLLPGYFPQPGLKSPEGDHFGYLASPLLRKKSSLPFTPANQALLDQLGDLMGDSGRETSPDSNIPAGFTYVGQFVDHDITLDISSSLDAATDANTIPNMRTPALDLDSLYGDGPGLDPFLYKFPSSGPGSAIKFQLGTNSNIGPGGPGGAGGAGGMQVQTDFDIPRMPSTLTAIIGDPRNDENLIVSQFHQAMLRFHNQVVDALVVAGFSGDVFVEAKRRVTHHYQWAVVNDFLKRVCGAAAVTAALGSVSIAKKAPFRMPVEFSVAAYRFGHSMIRDNYWVNFNFPNATLGQVFEFNRVPRLPVFSNWVVDFNAFFDTGVPVPVNNKARRIDSVLANGLESLPGFTGMMAVLAKRNLRRGLALGLPSGQGMASHYGVPALTAAQLTQGLPANEVALLNSNSGLLLKKTPLWYYILREANVLGGGNQLGPVGGRIVAETFVRILKRDPGSYLNTPGFVPTLPSAVAGDFTFADLLIFAGANQP